MNDGLLVFSDAVDGLLRSVGPLDANARARFRAVGVDPDKLEPAYPVALYVDLQVVAAELLAPGLPISLAMQTLGRRFLDSYGETLIGRGLLLGIKLLGPRRALARLERSLGTASNFLQSTLKEASPGVWHVWVSHVTWPDWYVGIISRGLEIAGADEPSVKIFSHEGPGRGLTLEVTWR